MQSLRALGFAAGLALGALAPGLAVAAPVTTLCLPVAGNPNSCQNVGAANPLPVTATASAPAASTELGFTVTTGGTFQSLAVASTTRKGCTVQNTSTHTMYVFAGTLASATTANSFQVGAGGTFQCASASGAVLGDQISATTSTTGDTGVQNFY